MANLLNVRHALFEHLDALVLTPTLPIAWPEAEAFTPPGDGRYLEASLVFNAPRFEALTDGLLDQGQLVVNVVWPRNQGDADVLAVAQTVRDHFITDPLLSLFHGGTKVKISGQPWISSLKSETSAVRVPVTVPWTA